MSGIINNGRMRKIYLPAEVLGGGFSREPDPAMTLNNTFKTMFFWIVSRANNCTYCQGHQEVKLSGDGVKEDDDRRPRRRLVRVHRRPSARPLPSPAS